MRNDRPETNGRTKEGIIDCVGGSSKPRKTDRQPHFLLLSSEEVSTQVIQESSQVIFNIQTTYVKI